MGSKYEISVIEQDSEIVEAIKKKSVDSLPDSPAAYGMRAAVVKPKFWHPLVQGPTSLLGVINSLIEQLNGNFKDLDDRLIPQQLRINPTTNMWEISADGGQTWSSMDVKATGIDITEIQASTSEDDDGINVVTIKLSNGNEFDFQVKNGSKGKTGDEFVMFYADYGTIAEMEAAVADQTDDGVPINGLVMIKEDDTVMDTETGETATGRIYRKVLKENGAYEYKFMGDLSGLRGPRGNDGETPVRGRDYWNSTDQSAIKGDLVEYIDKVILEGTW